MRPRASLSVTDPSGHRSTTEIAHVPFQIGRQPGNQLVLRDTRTSRLHARISFEDGAYWIEDLDSRHGTFVNGERVHRCRLTPDDRIELGAGDGYKLVFNSGDGGVARAIDAMPGASAGTPQLGKLKAVLEVARSLQSSASTDEILASVVDAALAVTGAERGFLLLRGNNGLELKVARDRERRPLPEEQLRVPRRVLDRALETRRDLLSMNFHPDDASVGGTIADLELRSIVCVPLVRMRSGRPQETSMLSPAADTAGLLYLDSRIGHADLSSGNRELLQTLALEASTIIENARLLEEERERQRLDGEMQLARQIQERLLPRVMPSNGWFRAKGFSHPCDQVGGDYFDVVAAGDRWTFVVADVSGKGVAASLLASFLQGALMAGIADLQRINAFLTERGESEKYATLFHGSVSSDGVLEYVNAGHTPALVVSTDGAVSQLDATSPPVGLLPGIDFPSASRQLAPGDKVVVYSDGILEASSPNRDLFGVSRLSDAVRGASALPPEGMAAAVMLAVHQFSAGQPAADDLTLLIAEYGARQ